MNVDPLGLFDWPSLPQGVVNGAAGFGDTLSFGATAWARSKLGINGGVDACSGNYEIGAGVGFLAGLVDGSSEAELILLNKQLASEAQMAEIISGSARSIAGFGSKLPLRQADRLAIDYGGEAANWQKVSSHSYSASDGAQFEIHAYRNAETGLVVEPKTKLQRGY